ncbi:hypothetical protein ICT70_08160 [Pelobacter sp. M08fum]|uniref:Uncharacterized protein n=1 Tax=Pelovirga terrestris TaxID=2771352 RepID=A0A8J6QLL5_9BACT|nr:hypothetical protein [Pelovirga terrestris]
MPSACSSCLSRFFSLIGCNLSLVLKACYDRLNRRPSSGI